MDAPGAPRLRCYQGEQHIGRGGFGGVYRALDPLPSTWSSCWRAVREPGKAREHAAQALKTLATIAENAPEVLRHSIIGGATFVRLMESSQ